MGLLVEREDSGALGDEVTIVDVIDFGFVRYA